MFWIAVVVIFAISFLLALRSLRQELIRLEKEEKGGHRLSHGVEFIIERNF